MVRCSYDTLGKDEFNSLNKSNACSVEGILSSCSTLGGFTYVRGVGLEALHSSFDDD